MFKAVLRGRLLHVQVLNDIIQARSPPMGIKIVIQDGCLNASDGVFLGSDCDSRSIPIALLARWLVRRSMVTTMVLTWLHLRELQRRARIL